AYPLAVADARVALARGNGEAAQAALETLTENHATDPELWALLGAAARAADHAPRAKQAYEKALELQPGNVDALLGLLNLAIEQSDTTAGHEALDRAASAGVTGRPLQLGRARLMVLEGGGAQAVPSLRRLSRGTRDATLYAALGQAYLQAEQSRRASRAFSRATRYDADELDAHIGLASLGIHAGGAQLRRAASHIGSADRIVQSRNLGARAQARIATLRAEVLYFGNGDMDAATEQARAAVALDPSVGEAHLLLASVLSERGQPADTELRAAIGCPSPPPEAFVRLALDLGATTEGCELARRYLTAAPRGSWASDARGLVERCE
ncbi:MAG: tetratricopeptide repeat protein, partial [Deltaproteobacteria bacterium]|nr:tetratricopeptide repeat protein [Deltaproteobacteria bacterium]